MSKIWVGNGGLQHPCQCVRAQTRMTTNFLLANWSAVMTWDQAHKPCLLSKPPPRPPPFAREVRLAVIASKMADHWVAEVFPPKFQFGSVDELLSGPGEDEKSKEKVKYLDEVYRKVYFEQEKAKKSTDDELHVGLERLERSQKKKLAAKDRKRPGKQKQKDQDECIWNESELKMLRQFLQKAKMQNLKLAAMLQSAQDEINTWKNKFKEINEADELLDSSYRILKKKYERLKVNYRALKDDVRKYHSSLKVAREECEQLKIERDDIVKSLSQTKAELNMEKLNNQHLQLRLDKKEKECTENLKSQEQFLEQQHLLEIRKLQKEVVRLTEKFDEEKQDNNLNKRALEHLRSHFGDLKVSQESNNGDNAVVNMLSVIDIDYLPA